MTNNYTESNKNLSPDALPITNSLSVEFKGVYLNQGKTREGNRFHNLQIKFQNSNWLNEVLFSPRNYSEAREFSIKLQEILNTLSEDDKLYQSIPIQGSWLGFYEKYIEKVNEFRGVKCYIKTLPKDTWKKGASGSNLSACLADKDFISLQDNVLEYTTLDKNLLESFGIDTEDNHTIPKYMVEEKVHVKKNILQHQDFTTKEFTASRNIFKESPF